MAVPFGIGKVIDSICELLQKDSKKDRESVLTPLNRLSAVLIAIFILGACCNAGRIYLMSTCGEYDAISS